MHVDVVAVRVADLAELEVVDGASLELHAIRQGDVLDVLDRDVAEVRQVFRL